jgi:hypothetical protein
MPDKETLERARKDKREGKSASTQAGEFVREEMHHIREGKHGAKSSEQAIAIGLSKARRAGVELSPPKKGQASSETRHSAESALRKGRSEDEAFRQTFACDTRGLETGGTCCRISFGARTPCQNRSAATWCSQPFSCGKESRTDAETRALGRKL